MKKMLFYLLGFVLFSFNTVWATDFNNHIKVTYDFNSDGTALVTNEVSIINLTDSLYVSEYTIVLENDNYQHIEAYDPKGKIIPLVDKNESKTIIKIIMNQAVVGKNQINSFVYRYQTDNYSRIVGNNHEIRLPKVDNINLYQNYEISIKAPLSFGNISSASPQPSTVDKQKNIIITYNKDSGLDKGVYLLFGEFQTYEINWQVNLENKYDYTVRSYIPLIPDTGYQKTFQDSITPLPDEVVGDNDGNWLAYFLIEPKQSLTVKGKTIAMVSARTTETTELSESLFQDYLQPTKYWPTNDPEITAISKKLKNAKEIYDYVINKLSYNYDRFDVGQKRLGGSSVLSDPENSICSEYTDLFITLARSIGIPARENEGYAFSQDNRLKALFDNLDILHAWPEYYDVAKKQWKMVDPTFGDTSGGIDYFNNFDNSHITFVLHGMNDSQPIPIGGYNNIDSPHKQVEVTVTSLKTLPQNKGLVLDDSKYFDSFNYIDGITALLGIRKVQGPFFSLLNQPVYFYITNTSGYKVNLPFTPPKEITLTNNDESVTLLPWQKYVLKGNIRPEEKSRRYYYNGDLNISGNSLKFEFPIVSMLALLFYLLIASGMLSFIWLLVFLKKHKREKQKTRPRK